jgi:hypothetical protein
MKMIHAAIVGLALLAVFPGCVSGPVVTKEQVDAAEVGPGPGEAEHAKIVARFEMLLKDPQSAQYKWLDPYKEALRASGKVDFGWVQPVLVNSKNSYGGYNGFERWNFFLIRGEVDSYQDPDYIGLGLWHSPRP